MGMTTPYKKGKEFENYIARKLREKGFYVARSAGSKGVFDLIAISPILLKCGKRADRKPRVYGIQAKVNGKFTKSEIEAMKEVGRKYNIVPVMAYKEGSRIVMKYVGNNMEAKFW